MDPFIGEIRPLPFNFAPRGWAFCNGQTLAISQYTALYALIGNQFGGDGRSTFNLPNLTNNLAVGMGQSPGNSYWNIGQQGGSATVSLNQANMPAHVHNLMASGNTATTRSVAGNQLAVASVGDGVSSYDSNIYVSAGANIPLSPTVLQFAGGNTVHGNAMPTQSINYCIALVGNYPVFN